jgi:hypothetical protein
MTAVGMFGMRNFRYRYTEKIIPILSVYRFFFDNYKGKFFNGNLKEILSNSKRENDNSLKTPPLNKCHAFLIDVVSIWVRVKIG